MGRGAPSLCTIAKIIRNQIPTGPCRRHTTQEAGTGSAPSRTEAPPRFVDNARRRCGREGERETDDPSPAWGGGGVMKRPVDGRSGPDRPSRHHVIAAEPPPSLAAVSRDRSGGPAAVVGGGGRWGQVTDWCWWPPAVGRSPVICARGGPPTTAGHTSVRADRVARAD